MDHFRDKQLSKLTERAKELRCIYNIIELLKDETLPLQDVFMSIITIIPPGWQHPTVCEVRIIYEGEMYMSEDFTDSPWLQRAEIIFDDHVAGEIDVVYTQNIPETTNPFLPEEQKLLNTIAHRLSEYIFFRQLKNSMEYLQKKGKTEMAAEEGAILRGESDEHWKWRYKEAEKIADELDLDRFGIAGVYLIGSTKEATAGPASDIDLLVHFRGTRSQRDELTAFISGWGLGLAELNYLKTGHQVNGSLIDCHIVTDEDIRQRTSYAVMIGALENSARPLKIKNS